MPSLLVNSLELEMDKFRRWYYYNHDKITWFIIGWLALSAVECISRGDYVGAVISGGFAVLNYKLNG